MNKPEIETLNKLEDVLILNNTRATVCANLQMWFRNLGNFERLNEQKAWLLYNQISCYYFKDTALEPREIYKFRDLVNKMQFCASNQPSQTIASNSTSDSKVYTPNCTSEKVDVENKTPHNKSNSKANRQQQAKSRRPTQPAPKKNSRSICKMIGMPKGKITGPKAAKLLLKKKDKSKAFEEGKQFLLWAKQSNKHFTLKPVKDAVKQLASQLCDDASTLNFK